MAPINGFQAFVPSLIPIYPSKAGLRIFIGSGTGFGTGPIAGYVVVGNITVAVPAAYVDLGPQSITYVYLDFATGTIRTNTTGFSGNIYPIAICATDNVEVRTLQDVRPDIVAPGTGGGGSTGPDTVQAFVASGSVALAANQNLFGTIVASASLLQLPSPAGLAGQSIKFVKIDSTGSTTIAGGSMGNYFLTNRGQFVIYETDGSSWYIIGASA